jgi:hypothetical protein
VFERRARGEEFLDRPDTDPQLVNRSFRFIRFVNRVGGGIAVVQRFLARELTASPAGPVRILDLGSGDCQSPLAVTQWAAKHGRQAEFTCLDHNAQVLDAAREALARAGCRTIQLEQADIFTYRPTREFDYAVGSMIFHHFTDEQIDSLIARLRSFVRRALLINDLRRCALSYAVCRFLTAGVDARLRHDALLSILRGFRPTELTASLSRHDPAAVARGAWFCRVAGVVRFNRGEGA